MLNMYGEQVYDIAIRQKRSFKASHNDINKYNELLITNY